MNGRHRQTLATWGRLILTVLLASLCLSGWPARAQEVSPSERVVTGVLIRESPSTDAPVIGALRPGQSLALKGMIARWHEVTLPDGRAGFVSKSWTTVSQPLAAGAFTVHAIDVGTGLAVFVEGPDFALLYDGGSNDDLELGPANRLVAYLKHVRPDLAVIDHVILSHPHRDHVELLPDVMAAYQVRNVWDSGRVNQICGYADFLAAIAAEPGVAYHDALGNFGSRTVTFEAARCYRVDRPEQTVTLRRASRITEAPVSLGASAQMTFLHADADDHGSANENSLVMRLDLGAPRILFMGDAEAGDRNKRTPFPTPGSIEGLLLKCCAADVKADILIVGHHGSMTSSRDRFMDAVSPRHMVISSGPMKYGTIVLPDQLVVDALEPRGVLWRTDLDDAACARSTAKIGRDADNEAGGCDNIVMKINGSTASIAYNRTSD